MCFAITQGLIFSLWGSSQLWRKAPIREWSVPHTLTYTYLCSPILQSIKLYVHVATQYYFLMHPFPHSLILSFSQVTVSSGGMLVMKLDPHDLQFANCRNFDGMYAYAQTKVLLSLISYLPPSPVVNSLPPSLPPLPLSLPPLLSLPPSFPLPQRQQVVMSRQWSVKWPDIHFSCMHPGQWLVSLPG